MKIWIDIIGVVGGLFSPDLFSSRLVIVYVPISGAAKAVVSTTKFDFITIFIINVLLQFLLIFLVFYCLCILFLNCLYLLVKHIFFLFQFSSWLVRGFETKNLFEFVSLTLQTLFLFCHWLLSFFNFLMFNLQFLMFMNFQKVV